MRILAPTAAVFALALSSPPVNADPAAAHYCAAQNQPRMKARPGSDVSRITFDFVDGTNLGAYPGRMQRLVILTPGPDRHVQEWTYRSGGKDSTDTFDLKRVP